MIYTVNTAFFLYMYGEDMLVRLMIGTTKIWKQ